MAETCTWRRDPTLGRYFVPGCMGGAVYGERACTCERPKERAVDRIARLERQVEDLTETVKRLKEARHG